MEYSYPVKYDVNSDGLDNKFRCVGLDLTHFIDKPLDLDNQREAWLSFPEEDNEEE